VGSIPHPADPEGETTIANGAYVDSSSPSMAESKLTLSIPQKGYWFIGCRIFFTEQLTGEKAYAKLISLSLRKNGKTISNEFESARDGYFRRTHGGMWILPVLGLWNLPKGEVEISFRAEEREFIAIDYFYLIPLFEVDGRKSVSLPINAGPASGKWTFGESYHLSIGCMAGAPNLTSWINYEAPFSGNFVVYVTAWHEVKKHGIDFEFGGSSTQIVLSADKPNWQTFRLGSFYFQKGKNTIKFTSSSFNPQDPDAPVAIENFLIIPLKVLTSL
jgi:hypothetical protein